MPTDPIVQSYPDSFKAKTPLKSGSKTVHMFHLQALADTGINLTRLPFSLRILLENLLRHEDGKTVTADDIEFLAKWDPKAEPSREIAYMPARVLMQDFTGVPAIVDLAAMRDAMKALGGNPEKINPLQPAELVIDHSVQVDEFGTAVAYDINAALEFQRNRERYAFLKWGQTAFRNFSAVPPGMGICHQVNLEYLARVVFTTSRMLRATLTAYPDTLVGTDSHTTMINGLGVLGWGVGGIEAEAAMLGQPVSMLVPQVVGFRLTGKLREGATATDLVLTVTEMLRKLGVVGKFVEFYGAGIAELPLADRATIANMAPEYGATCGIFPVDAETLRYLRLTGRSEEQMALVEAYYREQGTLPHAGCAGGGVLGDDRAGSGDGRAVGGRTEASAGPRAAVEGRRQLQEAVAGAAGAEWEPVTRRGRWCAGRARVAIPRRRQRTVVEASGAFRLRRCRQAGGGVAIAGAPACRSEAALVSIRSKYLDHGSIVIAAITSCTNTSNPYVMVAAGLLAKKAVREGSEHAAVGEDVAGTGLARGDRLLPKSGLLPYLDKLRFHVVGYGCTTCIGNSGPLPTDVSKSIDDHGLVAVSVLSGNRNFEGRITPEVRANYLMWPPLVVAYALAGRIDHDFDNEPLGKDKDKKPVFLRDIWPTQQEVSDTVASVDRFGDVLARVLDGHRWRPELAAPEVPDRRSLRVGAGFHVHPEGAVLRRHAEDRLRRFEDIHDARVLAVLGDSVTTDHISPAGSIKLNGPAGKYLSEHGVKPADFNSYGSRRGNHEVMVRGTFANVRLRNHLAPGTEGGVTRLLPEGEPMTIFDASVKYAERGTAAGDPCGQGVRLGFVARLGGEGAAPAGRARRDRRELRAHSPLEPGRHGHSSAAV